MALSIQEDKNEFLMLVGVEAHPLRFIEHGTNQVRQNNDCATVSLGAACVGVIIKQETMFGSIH